jgi:hypothetical protein
MIFMGHHERTVAGCAMAQRSRAFASLTFPRRPVYNAAMGPEAG